MDFEGASPARGGWGGLDNLFETPTRDVIYYQPKDLLAIDDPQCEFQAPLGQEYLRVVQIPRPVVIPTADSLVDLQYEVEFQRLDVGLAELVAEQEAKNTEYVNTLQQNISGPGKDVKYTATSAPFLVPLPVGTLDVAPTAPFEIPIPTLLDSTLELAWDQDGVAAEKVLNDQGSSSSGSSQQ